MSVVADLVVCAALSSTGWVLLRPLVRDRRVLANRLAVVTALIFFGGAVAHAVVGIAALLPSIGHHTALAEASRVVAAHTWVGAVATAAVACFLWTLRDGYGRRLGDADALDRLATARAAAERDRLDQQTVQQTVLDSLDDPVCMVSAGGVVLAANPASEELFRAQPAAVDGSSYFDPALEPIHEDGSPMPDGERPVSRALRTGQPQRGMRVGYRRPDGLRTWYTVNATPIFRSGETAPYAAVSVAHDVTVDRLTERLRHLAAEETSRAYDAAVAATAAKSAFLANMSHELRTPLNAVIGMNGLLLDTELTGEQRTFAETAVSSGEALLAIIDDVLDFSRLESGRGAPEAEPFDVRDCVGASVDRVRAQAAAKGLGLATVVDEAVPATVVGDAGRVTQILTKLLHNAVTFTGVGGVRVEVDCESATADTGRIVVRVLDTGIGIPASTMDRLFTSFSQVDASTTRTHGGTGLGLAISRGLAVSMGGDVSVRSEPGTGSEFTVTIPFDLGADSGQPGDSELSEDSGQPGELGESGEVTAGRCAQASTTGPGGGSAGGSAVGDGRPVTAAPMIDRRSAAAPARHAGLGPERPHLRVLFVEDNPVNQRVGKIMLGRLGHAVHIVDNGRQAVDAVQQSAFDLVIMDVQMPVMDGLEATRRIRAGRPRGGQPRILAMTASALASDRLACSAAGMDGYLAKPVRLRDLTDSVDDVLSRPPASGQPASPANPASRPVLPIPPVVTDTRTAGDRRLGTHRDPPVRPSTDFRPEPAPDAGTNAEPHNKAGLQGGPVYPQGRHPEPGVTATAVAAHRRSLELRMVDLTGAVDPAGDALVQQLLRSYLARVPQFLDTLRTGVGAADLAVIAEQTHGLAGMAANIGASGVPELCNTVSTLAAAGQWVPAGAALARLAAELDGVGLAAADLAAAGPAVRVLRP